ncbi:MAG: TIGR01777 family oxidoreductase [Actinomycetota bacterium]
MKVLVTGGTGFIGSALLEALASRGHELRVLSRDPAPKLARLPASATAMAWDPLAGPPPSEAIEGVDAVVNLAGEQVNGRWTDSKKQAIRESRVLTTRHLVDGIGSAGAPGARRPSMLVSASAIGFYGDRGDEELGEESAAGSGFLSSVCQQWEKEASRAESLGLTVARVRLGIVLGRGGGAYPRLARLFRLGLGGPVGSGRQWWSWIHLDDAIGFLIHVLEHRLGGAFNVSAPEPVRQRELADALGKALGRPALLPAPAFALRRTLGGFSVELLASRRVLPARAKGVGYRFRFPSLEPALRDLAGTTLVRIERQPDGTFRLTTELLVARGIEEVFEFFSDAHNLEIITPPELRLQVLTPRPIGMGLGTRIPYRFRMRGVPARWESEITAWEPPQRFMDTQRRGPFRHWVHTHEFFRQDGGTVARDHVHYSVPGGRVLHELFVSEDLRRLFLYRRTQLAKIFGKA